MPELPEVETVRRGLARCLEGHVLARVEQRRPDLRAALPERFAERLTGRRVEAVRRRAKYLLLGLDDGSTLIIHLGMSGRLLVASGRRAEPSRPHDHVILETDDGVVVRFNDARRFGLMALAQAGKIDSHPLIADLGPEPLGDQFDEAALSAALARRRTSIKAALLDQRVVAGLGNIYVSEALFHAGISPRRTAASVAGARAGRLVPAIRRVLNDAIAAGGSTLRDYVQSSGELGRFQHRFAVYDRAGQACPGCTCEVGRTGGIRRILQSGRSTFYCPRRQR
jgi:formamidopyrimidine-DNA glycosylase